MEIAVEEERSEVRGNMARLIESCICPIGYTGLSCQVMVPVSPGHLMKPCRLYWYLNSKHQCFSVENNLIDKTKLTDQQSLTDYQLWIIWSFHCLNLSLSLPSLACVSLTSHLSVSGMSPSPTRLPLSLSMWPASLSNLSLSLTCLSAGVCCRFFPSAIVWVVVSQSEVAVSSSVCSMPLQQPQWELRHRDWRLSGNMLTHVNTHV